jgi:chemosensory pili system protein ChpA (sensor histidine kinase/response regulator)
VRARSGKSETGEIALTVRQVGNEIAIELTDDGAGLDLNRIRAKAVAQGRIAADDKPSDEQLIACIFEPGFTTASKVTQVSGRGIGMDVVRAEIETLGGRVEVSTRSGKGTTFSCTCRSRSPSRRRCSFAPAGRLWALPAPMVEKVEQMKPEALVELYVQRRVRWQGMTYPFHYLPRLLGDREQIRSRRARTPCCCCAAVRASRHSRRRNDRQPGSRREEHRAPARARVGYRRRDRCSAPARSC